ncbi:MAG: hypothetical protein JST75_03965 [Bacteroidetes bacterium]|nr:hypothetical protein [Bacteroidota bacterium]
MKLQFVKSVASIAAVALLSVSNPLTSVAGTVKGNEKSTVVNEQADVKYAGANESAYLFRVEFSNPSAQKFSLIIKNEEGLVVYNEKFSDANFDKTFQLPYDGTDIQPTFIIRTQNGDIKRSFYVSRKVVENFQVTKL